VEGSNVLPSLLHEGNQEVDAHGDVLSEFFLAHVDGSDGGSHAVDLLGLELDGLLELLDLGVDLFSLDDVDGESVHLDEDVAEQLGGLLADTFGGEEDVVLLGPLLDFVLVLIEGLETVDVDVGNVEGLCFLDVDGVGKDANLNQKGFTLILV
jgi:hypothetical protein